MLIIEARAYVIICKYTYLLTYSTKADRNTDAAAGFQNQ